MATPPPAGAAGADALPSLSIIMPSHNRRDRLERAARAIQRQDYPRDRVELIVVLDGCRDGSRAMLDRLADAGGPRLVVLEQPGSGPAIARNRGCAAATGELIVFVDDDVVAAPRLLAEHAAAHRRHDRLVVIGTMMPPHDFDRPVWVRWEERMLLRQYAAMTAGAYRPTYRQFFSGNSSVRRRWFEASGGFEAAFRRAEDIELAWRFFRLGLEFEFAPQAEGVHYAHRSYASWRAMHHAYGVADVMMARRHGNPDRIAIAEREFRARSPLIRAVSMGLLDRPTLQAACDGLFRAAGESLSALGLHAPATMCLSCVANYQFWQGFNDALRAVPAEADAPPLAEQRAADGTVAG
jgi:GT2 family glycosyltransferase